MNVKSQILTIQRDKATIRQSLSGICLPIILLSHLPFPKQGLVIENSGNNPCTMAWRIRVWASDKECDLGSHGDNHRGILYDNHQITNTFICNLGEPDINICVRKCYRNTKIETTINQKVLLSAYWLHIKKINVYLIQILSDLWALVNPHLYSQSKSLN